MTGSYCVSVLLAAWLAAAAAESLEQAAPPVEESRVQPMTASNWTLVMEGEWMLKFYAPWCPSCQQTDSEWETFAKNGETLQISVGKVDVIQEPGTVNVVFRLFVWFALVFPERFLCSIGACPGTCFVDQAGLELGEIRLPLPPQCWHGVELVLCHAWV
ncbi:Tmx4 [Phodopus roborovskii]|uniref:Tmx4 protein n=1 Tax=Phodopus roborovskii TaxID=109678 RepID=A0AAU9Z6K3_PHORO|nr:Tmx4 [Phodopus roborovskii]